MDLSAFDHPEPLRSSTLQVVSPAFPASRPI